MESRRQRKGLWTLAVAACSANHFNACGPAMSPSHRRCDTRDGCPLEDHQMRSTPSRIRARKFKEISAQKRGKEDTLNRSPCKLVGYRSMLGSGSTGVPVLLTSRS
jgi:hypothetical protein